ncbi:hypothetical protein [Mycobacterium sp. 852002-51961_SCH5331710]|uniref:hypothetical protein n=1 Tax=Mycobacterium sp. 852002-51961_SCH5331710 TaxID=1834105 RepID=UPI0007FEF893|nr:hypothetical protein [Mycobacterium sp. 852002-51961_SCH5331710]OBB42694.1 hypothetical protein A5752_06165 [Mycobacterium sp. 852002-51961_SCH5331710]
MILHDRVDVWMQVDTGETDTRGNPILEWQKTAAAPAAIIALNTDAVLTSGRDLVISRYRVILAPVANIPPDIGDKLRLSWPKGGHIVTDPSVSGPGLYVDGTVERHMLRGRLHHYELITQNVM